MKYLARVSSRLAIALALTLLSVGIAGATGNEHFLCVDIEGKCITFKLDTYSNGSAVLQVPELEGTIPPIYGGHTATAFIFGISLFNAGGEATGVSIIINKQGTWLAQVFNGKERLERIDGTWTRGECKQRAGGGCTPAEIDGNRLLELLSQD